MKSFILVGLVVLFGSVNAFAGYEQCVNGKCLLAPAKVVHNGLVAVVESRPVQLVENVVHNATNRVVTATRKAISRPKFFKRRHR